MVNLYIDNISVSVKNNSTVLQACDSLGIDVPRFCFHERLLIAGNCRMCLVEIEKSPKPVASCALPVSEGMKVFTKTPLVKKAQEGVLEFLLLNHPLDCPICDQGGECDLQDQVMLFGSDSSRFYEQKRGVEDKNCGPLIKTIMTRCIHCTRCVRFSTEVAGVPDLGTLGRGTNTQIGTYIEKILQSELSGNVIDLCPVGALTSKPYAFKARSWELKSTESIDISDSCGSNIIVNVKGTEVIRILPSLNENINEEWISDKTRFSYDGLGLQRLGVPLVKNKELSSFKELGWNRAFKVLFSVIHKDLYNLDSRFNIIFGKDTDLETVLTLKYMFNRLNCFSLYSSENFCTNSSDIFYKLNTQMRFVNNYDLCILVNCNTRFEASMLNLHLRKAVNKGSLEVGFFGPSIDLTFDTHHLGLNNESFLSLLKGQHPFSKNLKKAKNPLFIVGANNFSNSDMLSINNLISEHLDLSSLNLGVLNIEANSVSLREIGIKSMNDFLDNFNNLNSTYNLYMNTNLNSKQVDQLLGNGFAIYCGSHGLVETNQMDLVLPGKAFTEKRGSFINLEGLLQNTNKSLVGLGESREDWKIFKAFSDFIYLNTLGLNTRIIYEDFFSLFNFFIKEYKVLKQTGCYNKPLVLKLVGNNSINKFYIPSLFYKARVFNFYKTNIMSCFSSIMTECSNSIRRFNFDK